MGRTERSSVEGSDALFCTVDDGTGERGGPRIHCSRGRGSSRDLRVNCAGPPENVGSCFAVGCRAADGGFRCRRSLREGVQFVEAGNRCLIPRGSEWSCPGSAEHNPTDNQVYSKG